MFYFMEDFEIANYADNLTPFSAKLNHKLVVEELETSSSVLFTQLQNNNMKANTDKSHLFLSGSIKFTAKLMKMFRNQKIIKFYLILLGFTWFYLVLVDSNLSLNKISTIYVKKPAQSLMLLQEYPVIWTFQNVR